MELRWFYLYSIHLHQKEKIIQIIFLRPTKSATLACKQFRCISHSKACKMKPSFANVTLDPTCFQVLFVSRSSPISGSSNPHSAHTSFPPSFSFSPSISPSPSGDSAVTLFWKNSIEIIALVECDFVQTFRTFVLSKIFMLLIYNKEETQRCTGFHFPCSCICALLISFLLTLNSR